MDESWLKKLNKRNLLPLEEDFCKSNSAIVTISSSVLNKLSREEQAKFEKTEFKRATNEIEHWSREEEICDFFGVEDPSLAGVTYMRRFNLMSSDDEIKWLDLKDLSDSIPEGFGVKVDWF